MNSGTILRGALTILLFAFLGACGSGGTAPSVTPPSAAAPVISSFTASPMRITAGGQATLSFSVTGATNVSISPSPGAVTMSPITVTPQATTNYVLTASSTVGAVTASIEVIVDAAPDSGAASDVEIGDAAVDYKDPEIYSAGNKIAFQDEVNQIWLADLDPRTGLMIPENGKGTLAGQAVPIESDNVTGVAGSWNGPEWGFGRSGPSLFFTMKDSSGVNQVGRYRLSGGPAETVTSGGASGRSGPLPSKNPDDAQTLFMAFVGRFRDNIGVWRREGDSVDRSFPSDYFATSGPQWILDEPAIATNMADANGVAQVVRYDVDTGRSTVLTSGPGDKFDTYFFRDPQQNNRVMFITTRALEQPTDTIPTVPNELVIYGSDRNGFSVVRTLQIPEIDGNARVNHWSAEPFVYRGKVYFSLSAMAAGGFNYSSPSNVYVLSIDGTLVRQVSRNDRPLPRIDPETYVTENTAFIFYYTVESGRRRLHLCDITNLLNSL